ncbi:agmatine deiminase family protein [Furfurilactobacillus sp. WILCCON 0119]
MIYTAMPRADDRYYRPVNDDLIRYNQTFAAHLGENDQLLSITKRTMPFPTTSSTYDDIWVRDVAPIITTKMVKFKHSPAYLKKSDSRALNTQFTKWLTTNHFNYQTSALVLDGGNVQWNHGDAVVVTNRVFADNRKWSHKAVINELKTKLNVKKVVVIPAEPGDTLAHSDGMIKFLSPKLAFISDFEGDTQFRKKVAGIIQRELPDVKLVTIKSAYTEKGQFDPNIASARGLYINMLETDKTIYVPQFDLKADHSAIKFIQSYTDKTVVGIPINKVSTLGGALHCTTWEVPAAFQPK